MARRSRGIIRRNVVAAALATFMLAGCGGMKLDHFEDTQPALTLEDYFDGSTRAWGVFHDRFGKLRRRFTVDIAGTFDGKVLTLDEDFLYDDGEVQKRVWTIEVLGDGRYRGSAGDVVGVAEGRTSGAAMNWTYVMDLAVGDGTWRVGFDDWLVKIDEDTVYNRATVSKWGFEIGTVTLFFRRADQPAS
ncbi:MAG: DUF3833 domain-containing protein [Geminicoccaceae bacterium]